MYEGFLQNVKAMVHQASNERKFLFPPFSMGLLNMLNEQWNLYPEFFEYVSVILVFPQVVTLLNVVRAISSSSPGCLNPCTTVSIVRLGALV